MGHQQFLLPHLIHSLPESVQLAVNPCYKKWKTFAIRRKCLRDINCRALNQCSRGSEQGACHFLSSSPTCWKIFSLLSLPFSQCHTVATGYLDIDVSSKKKSTFQWHYHDSAVSTVLNQWKHSRLNKVFPHLWQTACVQSDCVSWGACVHLSSGKGILIKLGTLDISQGSWRPSSWPKQCTLKHDDINSTQGLSVFSRFISFHYRFQT